MFSACGSSGAGPSASAGASSQLPSAGAGNGGAPSSAGAQAAGALNLAGTPGAAGARTSGGGSTGSEAGAASAGRVEGAAGVAGQASTSDGGAPAAGSGSTAAGSAGTTSAGSAGAGCQSVFCEDFESGMFAPATWTTNISGKGNSATVAKGISAHGSYAAAFHYAGTRDTWAFALVKALPVSLQTHHFGRVNVLMQPGLPDRHTEILSAGSPGFPTSKYLEVAGVGASFQLTYVDLVGGGEDYKASGAIPGARWFCLEWEFNDAPDEIRICVDGAPLGAASTFSLNSKSTGLIGGMSEFGLGYRVWGSGAVDTPKDYYFDDLAIDTKRVACLPK